MNHSLKEVASRMTVEPKLETRCLSSLVKVFADQELDEPKFEKGSALRNETYSFQIAYRMKGPLTKNIKIRTESTLGEQLSIRRVGLVPSELPCYHDHDDFILRAESGLYPDPLYPIARGEGITAFPSQWRTLWVQADLNEETAARIHSIKVIFETDKGQSLAEETFKLEVIPERLPEQSLIHTEWFHCDCLAKQYKTEIFSELHWELIERYVETAVKHGINMILTPLFTPPLDTEIGGERPTVQLVDVYKKNSSYRFSFDRLNRWISLCSSKGIKYFEFAHLFTQWGAEHAPKIMAEENGELNRIFGWETDAAGEEYKNFLSQFLFELKAYIKNHQLEERVYFHISDEPRREHLQSYRLASEAVKDILQPFPIIDALSDYEFYRTGLVQYPIPSNDHIEPFLENKVPNLWTYYCCSQYKKVSNRFFNFPSVRNRMIGMQLYKYNIVGFLHWGYNFWFSQLSKKQLNPFQSTDAGHSYPSGDAFLVYPGEEEPIESIRLEVFYEALQDLRALQLLEELIGRDQTIKMLEDSLERPLTFSEYPKDDAWLLNKREEINQRIAEETRKRDTALEMKGRQS
jgi:hypothetical protein